jgi:hypothetical protein
VGDVRLPRTKVIDDHGGAIIFADLIGKLYAPYKSGPSKAWLKGTRCHSRSGWNVLKRSSSSGIFSALTRQTICRQAQGEMLPPRKGLPQRSGIEVAWREDTHTPSGSHT